METQTKDELIDIQSSHIHKLEEKITFLERHVFYLQHDLRVLKAKKQ